MFGIKKKLIVIFEGYIFLCLPLLLKLMMILTTGDLKENILSGGLRILENLLYLLTFRLL